MSLPQRPTAVVVDPYSTGVLIAPALRKRGYDAVCVQSGTDLAPSLRRSYRAEDFGAHILFDGNLEALVARLRPLQPAFVLPGNESAVELADRLGEALGTRGNGTRLSLARRNKYRMIETLAAAGLLTARQCTVQGAEEAVAWAEENGWPVVAKPLDSASTDNVAVCASSAELAVAVERILSSVNFCGRRNEAALVQTYLDGEEYVVNSISRDGRHYVCDVLHSAKRTLNGTPLVYDYYRLLPADGDVARALIPYILRTLDALEIRNGAAHAEIRLTGRGPALIEIAARAMGPYGSTQAVALGTGHDQVDLLVDAFDDARILGPLLGGTYAMRRHAMVVYLPLLAGGRIRELPDLRCLDGLASVRGHQLVPGIGDRARPTVDLSGVLAKVYLAHEDGAVVEHDYGAIRGMETALQPLMAESCGVEPVG